MLKKFILMGSISLVATLGIGIKPANSQAVRNISIGVARGDVDGGATVTVWPGHGLNLDFSLTGEIIRKVWLDDPSKVIADFDGNISGGGARIIHLRRITPIKIPELPSTSSTLLTIVTEGRGGTTNLYSFKINYGNGTPEYTTVRINDTPVIIAQPPPTDTSETSSTVIAPLLSKSDKSPIIFDMGETQLNSNHISMGLSRQCWNGLMPLSSWNYGKAKNFLTLINRGFSADDALQQSGITESILIRLSKIGENCQIINN
ncbi:MAG: hypothetical protein F6K22_02415 [Okeania sp. SIO2F4]|uniref:hypothetical protein n=1 Tax=Okeania sp. SIO2F4 TaxID=2607790 RepID=UPI0014290423|nr:hypothetical protein [Okeania sp. SIO2F4]NES01777.1 hypothetical protein [Okeania sp. SIO2F4]